MNIGIDLRGLNYTALTGVNTYTIHFLYCLSKIKSTQTNLKITSIGLKNEAYQKLYSKYPFMNNLFDSKLSLSEYYGIKYFGVLQPILSFISIIKMRLTKNIIWPSCYKFDILLQPQPKPILKHKDTKLLTVFHDIYGVIDTTTMSFRQKILENKFTYKLLADSSFKVFANSLSTAFDLHELISIKSDKIHLVYPALPIWDSISTSKAKSVASKLKKIKGQYMLCVSGVEPRKNWFNILKAFKHNQIKYSDFNHKLILVGRIIDQNYYNLLVKYINTNKLKNVIFYSDLSQIEKEVLYKNCDFVVYPSFYEGFGFPILESFKYNKPVITSKISSMPEIAREGGVYINPLNYLEIAAAMYILKSDRVFYKLLADSISKSKEVYSWDELEFALKNVMSVDKI